MKLSISLTEADVRVIDEFAARHGDLSRSAVVQRAVRALRVDALAGEYADAFAEWEGSDDARLWDGVAGDGLGDAPR